jgi:2-dehydro-3-deoxygalactonokinase
MTHFVSCDWGTSRFRLRLFDLVARRIVAEYTTGQGIQVLAAAHSAAAPRQEALGNVLESGIAELGAGNLPGIPVVISGMASSTLGWHSLPYAGLPAPIDGSTLHFLDFRHAGRRVRLVSGLRAQSDVMRGEETELIGLFAAPGQCELADDCIVVMPGTHSKHVRLRARRIVDFTTHLTGELYGLLCHNSSLDTSHDAEFDAASFGKGVQAARDLGVTAALFQTRARTVLGHLDARHSRAFLSGVLVGAEIATLAGMPAVRIVLAAPVPLARPYAMALRDLLPDAAVLQIPPAELAAATVAGQTRILSYG